MKKFSQVREQYFGYLQKVIKNNCAYYGSPIAEDILDSLATKMEQHALLSCLQIDIYENFLTKIISDIEKCTKERQIHNEVKKLLPDSEDKEAVVCDEFNGNSPEYKKCLETITVPNLNYSSNKHEIILTDQIIQTLDQSPSHSQQYSEPCTLPRESDQTSSLFDIRTDDDCDISNNKSNFTRKEPEAWQSNKILQSSPSVGDVSSSLQNENDSSNKHKDLKSIPLSPQNFIDSETCDSLSESSKLIEKCMETIFGRNEINDGAVEVNDERAYIMQILEDENPSDDTVDDVHSEDDRKESENEREKEAEAKSETETNLGKRLEKMKELFNTNERQTKRRYTIKLKKRRQSKPNENKETEGRLKRLTAWKNEKIIQLYKVSILTSRLSCQKREDMQKLFVKLFGEDSDEEHEFEYGSSDQFRTSCIERISAWVVKHLMPFYHKRRIIGRKVFKSLGRRISRSIIDKIQYPDERTVKYFVHKCFPPNKRYGSKSKSHQC